MSSAETGYSGTLRPEDLQTLTDRKKRKEALIQEANRRVSPPSAFDQDLDDFFIIPGTGDRPSSCKTDFPVSVCPNPDCGRPHLSQGTCKTSTCPACNTTWRYDRTESLLERLWTYKLTENARLDHYTLSPPPELAEGLYHRDKPAVASFHDLLNPEDEPTREEQYPKIDRTGQPVKGGFKQDQKEKLRELRKWANKVAKRKVDGGALMFHPYRLTRALHADECERFFKNCTGCPYADVDACKYFELKERARKEGDWEPGEFGMWVFLSRDVENWANYVYWSPHFHVIGVLPAGARWRQGGKAEDKRWVWRHLGKLNTFQDLVKLSMYLLSHVGIYRFDTWHTITYIGDLHQSKWNPDPDKSKNRHLKRPPTRATHRAARITHDLTETHLGNFRKNNGEEPDHDPDECGECETSLIDIHDIPQFLAQEGAIQTDFHRYLFTLYQYQGGNIPPPPPESEYPRSEDTGKLTSKGLRAYLWDRVNGDEETHV